MSKRERVIMLQPRGKGLLGATLRYPYEVRDEAIYFGDIGDIQIPKDMLALAEHILESKAATFDPTLFHDRYEEAVVAMLNEKRAGMPIPKQRPMPRIVAGTDLMAALRQSIEKAKEETPKTAAKQAAPAVGQQRSLLRRPKASALRKAARTSARCCCRLRAARPRSQEPQLPRKGRRNRQRKSLARGRRRDSRSLQRAINPIAAALAMSTKKAETSGRMMKACAHAPCSLVTAVILAMAVGVAPRLTPVNPAEITAA